MSKVKQNIYIGILISLTISLLSVLCMINSKSSDADWNWHCVLGQEIVEGNANFYGADNHSWIAKERNLREMQHSWLGSVTIYLCTLPFSSGAVKYGALLYVFITVFITVLLLHMMFLSKIKNFAAYMISLIPVIYFIVFNDFTARPRNIGYILFIAALYLLQEKENCSCVLIIISTIWANVHGGSILMYFMFLAVFALINAVKDFDVGLITHRQNLKKAKSCLYSLLACMISGMVNPYFADLYMYAIFENQSFTKQYVQEWKSAGLLADVVILTLICFFIIFVVMNKTVHLDKLIPVILTLGMTGLHIRMGIYLFIALIPLITDILKVFDKKAYKSQTYLPYILCSVMSCCLCIEIYNSADKYERYELSNELTAYLQDKQYERMYNDYDTGALLIYNGFHSFIDARADFYTEGILVPAMDFNKGSLKGQGEADKFIETFGFDAIMLNQQNGFVIDYLLANDWFIDYKDEYSENELNYVVLVKEN